MSKHCQNPHQLFWITWEGFAFWLLAVTLSLVEKQAPVSTVFIDRWNYIGSKLYCLLTFVSELFTNTYFLNFQTNNLLPKKDLVG